MRCRKLHPPAAQGRVASASGRHHPARDAGGVERPPRCAAPDAWPKPRALYRFDDFTGFIEGFKAVTRRLTDPEDYELVAWRMMQHLAEQGVVHAEVFISVGVIYMWRNFDPRALRADLCRPGTGPRARRARAGPLALLDLRRGAPLYRGRGGRASFARPPSCAPVLSLHHRHRPGRRRAPAAAPSPSAPFTREARGPACGSPTTPAKPPGRRPSGRRFASVRSGSGTRFRPSRTQTLMEELKEREIATGTEPDFERPHRRLRLVCRAPAAPLFRCRAAGDAELRRPGLLRFRSGQRISAGPHRAGLHPRGASPAGGQLHPCQFSSRAGEGPVALPN